MQCELKALKTRAADGVIPRVHRLRTRSSDVQGQKMDVPAQGERELALPATFHCSRASADWMMPAHLGKGDLSTQSTHSNANLFWKHLHRQTQK